MKKPYEIIKIDKYTRKIQTPTLLLMNRSLKTIGKISRYENWNISLVGNSIDEIRFEVHKYIDGKLCPIWNDLIDLKIVNVSGFGNFEISVDYTDNTETIKSVHGVSLETELAQIYLYEFHINDDEATDMVFNDNLTGNYDDKGNYVPTVFYNEDDPAHSLLHRVLADKAPHWKIGHVPKWITLSEDEQPEESSSFQRTYTVDGDSIYDFLTGTVAEESNVVFLFDTLNRIINCYNLCDCIDQETGKILEYSIGEDTTVLVSKRKLANEITISSNKNNVKNCFRIEGGDDIITDMVRAVNMNGSNYIFQLADFQYNDMSEKLRKAIIDYQEMMSSKETQDEYYGENGIFTRLCEEYDDLSYYESSMMPDTKKVLNVGSAEEQYNKVIEALKDTTVAVSSMNNYNDNLFVGVTNNIEAYAQIFLDSRFDLEVVSGTTSYTYDKNANTGIWSGKIQIKQHTDETNIYPVNMSAVLPIDVKVTDDELTFTKQKIEKKLSQGSMLDIDFDIAGMNNDEIRNYFEKYSLNRLKSFYDGYNSCISVLLQMDETSEIRKSLYDKYINIITIISNPPTIENPKPVLGALEIRQEQVNGISAKIDEIKKEQNAFIFGLEYNNKQYTPHDFKTYIGEDLYIEFCAYRREDTYSNPNYISDGLTTSECLEKAKELIEAATKEAKKACVLQRTVSTSLNNLFALPEFEPLYDKFALYNYIRIRTDDEILKLRLIGIEFNGDSIEEIQVTFSEQVESVDGTTSDLQSIIQQAGNMATSYSSTVLQAKQGSEAKSKVLDMYNNGINTANTMLTNNDSNEITITPSGIICKRMDDEGIYGEKQFRITGNMMVFTKDNWKTTELAIGETIFEDPVTGEKKPAYGIIAENIVGKLMMTENMYIGDKNGRVQISGNGITVGDNFEVTADGKVRIEGDIWLRNSLYLYYEDEYGMGEDEDGFYECFKIDMYSEAPTLYCVRSIVFDSDIYTTGSGDILTSDRNLKHDIYELDKKKSSQFIYSLKPSKFKYNNGTSDRFHHGFIAQDVKESLGKEDSAVYVEQKDGTKGLRYDEFIADMVATLQTQNERISYLENKMIEIQF